MRKAPQAHEYREDSERTCACVGRRLINVMAKIMSLFCVSRKSGGLATTLFMVAHKANRAISALLGVSGLLCIHFHRLPGAISIPVGLVLERSAPSLGVQKPRNHVKIHVRLSCFLRQCLSRMLHLVAFRLPCRKLTHISLAPLPRESNAALCMIDGEFGTPPFEGRVRVRPMMVTCSLDLVKQ